MKIRVLIVEDEGQIRWSLRQKFEERGWQVAEVGTGQAALDTLAEQVFDLVLLDYRLPDITGIDVLRGLRQTDQDAVVIMMTAYSTIETAVEAIKLGAFNYITKPFQISQLMLTIEKALETTQLRREVRELRRQMQQEYGIESIVGTHPSMLRLFDMVKQVARTGVSTVFIRGETGTGKDLLARVIHHASERAASTFVNITCTALSETLLESELFGHERGAFTDAKAQKKGLLEMADGGTVFLDEVGDMPGTLQAKLLRFLEERRFRRVGGTKEISVDVRVMAATNRDLESAIEQGLFRRDLMYRLNVVTIQLPPLDGSTPGLLVARQRARAAQRHRASRAALPRRYDRARGRRARARGAASVGLGHREHGVAAGGVRFQQAATFGAASVNSGARAHQ